VYDFGVLRLPDTASDIRIIVSLPPLPLVLLLLPLLLLLLCFYCDTGV
jgi:hypothetical protein